MKYDTAHQHSDMVYYGYVNALKRQVCYRKVKKLLTLSRHVCQAFQRQWKQRQTETYRRILNEVFSVNIS